MTSSQKNKWDLATRVIHGGQKPDPMGAVMPPIVTSSTFVQDSPGELKQGYDYSRGPNPTRQAYEACINDLEVGVAAFAFSSGLAAINTVMQLLKPGDHVLSMHDLYGGSHRLFTKICQQQGGLNFDFIDMTKSDWHELIKPETKMIWLESPTNPLMQVVDIAAIAEKAKEHGVLVAVDSTFATPIIQQPLCLGCDIVVHSATKYLNGHSDIIGGVVVTNCEELAEKIGFLQFAVGAVASPFDSYMALRGMKTLELRMQRHAKTALFLAKKLESHPEVEAVFYPGLPSHPQYDLAQRQMALPGGMISFRVKGDLARSTQILKSCEVFTLAESLGGVESLIELPALMTHASLPASVRKELGITDNLIRLSAGIESADDLWSDLQTALLAPSHHPVA